MERTSLQTIPFVAAVTPSESLCVGYAGNSRTTHAGHDGFSVYRGGGRSKSDFTGRIGSADGTAAPRVRTYYGCR
jgi:hypothetical protein